MWPETRLIKPLGFAAMATTSASRGHAARWAYKAAIAASVSAREHKVEEDDVTGLALGHIRRQALGRRQGRACGRDVTLSQQDLRLAGVGHGKTGIGGDGPVISLEGTGVERQRQTGGLNVGIPRRRRRRRQSKI